MDKSEISKSIVSVIKALEPPGRFLEYDERDKRWVEISDGRAIDKTSQALRERSTNKSRNPLDLSIGTENNDKRNKYETQKTLPIETAITSISKSYKEKIFPVISGKSEEFDDLLSSDLKKNLNPSTTATMISCLDFDKTVEELCQDEGVDEKELDFLIFQIFASNES